MVRVVCTEFARMLPSLKLHGQATIGRVMSGQAMISDGVFQEVASVPEFSNSSPLVPWHMIVKTVMRSMKPKISALNDQERAWIATQLRNAGKFVEAFSFGDSERPLTLGALDRAFSAWLASEPSDRDFINSVINYVGTAFGNALVEGLAFEWVIATDENGSDLAVYACPGRGDVLVFPANFIAKRWEGRESNFIERSYLRIMKDVQQICQKHDAQHH